MPSRRAFLQVVVGSVVTGSASLASAAERDIEAAVIRIILEQLDVDRDDVKRSASFVDDLGADSLGLVELVLAFEEEFGLEIPDDEAEKLKTVGDAVDYIEANVGHA